MTNIRSARSLLSAAAIVGFAVLPLRGEAQAPVAQAGLTACSSANPADATAAGRTAARDRSVVGYAVAGFATGVTVGFMAPIAIGEASGSLSPEMQIFAAGLGGAAATIALAGRSPSLPAAEGERVRGCSVDIRDTYSESYRSHLRQRRLRAAGWGTAAGIVSGVGLLAFLLSMTPT